MTRKHTRPLSADLGGLHLATAGSGFGQGWLGYSGEIQTRFAELLTDMYNETLNAVNECDVEFAPTDLPTETRTRLIHSLDSWNFEPHKLPDEEVLSCTMILFEALFRIENMQESVGVSLNQIYPLIHHLRRIYRWENTYHNFEHALDVLQCSYIFLRSAGMVPPVSILLEDPERTWKREGEFDCGPLITCLGAKELFVIYIAAIGHDVAHPGVTNLFMKNAETPLSMVYDGKSALEQMHCSLLLRVMRHHGLGGLLDDTTSHSVRKLVSETVLATDMSVHAAFMKDFRSVVDDENEWPTREARIEHEGEDQLWRRQVLLCQGLMKCADISNPCRPYHVSQHWAAALMGEWTSQAMLEKCMDLPCTVQCSDDPLTEANGQVFFINTFAKPLLELIVEAVPELQPHLDQCQDNLRVWETRRVELQAPTTSSTLQQSPSPVPIPSSPALSTASSRIRRDDYLTAFPLALPKHHPYRNVSHVNQYTSVGSLAYDRGSEDEAPAIIGDAAEQDRTHETERDGEESDEGQPLPPPSSCTSTATSVTLVWPSSAVKQNPFGTSSTPPFSSHSEVSESSRSSLSTPSSPSGSVLDSMSSMSGDSEYMSVAEWGHGCQCHDDGPYQTTGEGSSVDSASRFGTPYSGVVVSANGSSNRLHGHYRSSTTNTMYDPHAGLRAAADIARAGLRKKQSMSNRKSWGAPVREFAQMKHAFEDLSASESAMAIHVSLPPPPMTSPASLGGGEGLGLSGVAMNDQSTMTTPKGASSKRKSTIVIAEPHPRDQTSALPVA